MNSNEPGELKIALGWIEVFMGKNSYDSWIMPRGEVLIILNEDHSWIPTMMPILTNRGLGYLNTIDLWMLHEPI